MKSLLFALRSFARDLRAGELRVLALALAVAVASVTAVGFFTDRIGKAMELQAADVLAADIRATAGRSLPESVFDEAGARGLSVARTVMFPSVVIDDDDDSQLVAVKAVTATYPLRGELRLSSLAAPDQITVSRGAPAPGTIWVEAQLVNLLELSADARLLLGNQEFLVTHQIEYEPDRGENIFELAPRVMMAATDVEGAGLLGEGSRARYAGLFAGDTGDIEDFANYLNDSHATELRVQGVRDGSAAMRRALERAESFLGLAAVVTVLLAGAAIALAVRQFAQHQADASAVMRTLGASRAEVTAWLAWRLLLIAALASVAGVAIGWVAQLGLGQLLREWFSLALPAPGWRAPVVGVLTALVALAGFGMQPVLRAGRVPVMRVLQRDYSGLDVSAVLALLGALVAAFAVVLLQAGSLRLSAIVLGGVVVMLLVFALFGRLMIRAVRQLPGHQWRLSVAGLERRAGSSIVQLAAFALGIMALLLITIVRTDVLAAWERDVPENAANVFVVNIQPDQVDRLRARLQSQGIEVPGIFPMVRARLVAHNDERLIDNEAADEHQRRHARREYNLTYTDTLPASNTLAGGEWWSTPSADAEPQLSLEAEWAEHMGYELGDQLTFKVAAQEVTGTISSFREVDWESFSVNFFAVGTESLLAELPHTFVTSFYLEDDFSSATTAWVKEFPGIATLDVGAIIARVKALMDRAAMAVEYVFLFTLAAGLVVLLAAVQSSQAERIRESAILRAIGASHAQVRRAAITEFAILGAIAGFLAALFATAIAWGVSHYVLELPFQFNPWLWIIGVVAGAVGISVAGYLATRRVLRTPPLVALRSSL